MPPQVPSIPFERWHPLRVEEAVKLFQDAPFQWALAGGYCVEQFLGRPVRDPLRDPLREHADIDVMVFRDQHLLAQAWLADWVLYAADPPGQLRYWPDGEILPAGVQDIWTHQPDHDAWQLQLMLAEADEKNWYFRKDRAIGGHRKDLIAEYNGLPCVRIEVQLFYKSRGRRPKDEIDFEACRPHLDRDAKTWLRQSIQRLFPGGHPWLAELG